MTTNEPPEISSQNESPGSSFIYVACRPASQALCKKEISDSDFGKKQATSTAGQFLPAFSRPGFLTYKLTGSLPDRFDLPLTFGRTWGWSVGQLKAESLDEVEARIRVLAKEHGTSRVHIWRRDWVDKETDQRLAGDLEEQQLVEIFEKAAHPPNKPPEKIARLKINQVAEADQKILDVIRVDPGHWWFGWHIAGSIQQRWPGGIPILPKPETMVSRAYMKTCEGLMWSGANISRADTCAEIGSAPGGCCQRLLELGAQVIAIDPADLDPKVAKHKRLTHLKMRGKEVPHRSLANVSWLLADHNVAPAHTLDTVEAMVNSEHTRIRGLLLTLKFADPNLPVELPSCVERIRSLGFKFVKTRQLAYGRQEVLLMALKQKAVRRFRG